MRRIFIGALVLLAGRVAMADPATVFFEGIVEIQNDGFPPLIGTAVSGSYVLDDSTAPQGPGYLPNSVIRMTIEFAGGLLRIEPIPGASGQGFDEIRLVNDGPFDSYLVGGLGDASLDGTWIGEAGFTVSAYDPTGTMLDGVSIFDVPSFDPPRGSVFVELRDIANNQLNGAFGARLTSWRIAALEVDIDLRPGKNPSTVHLGSSATAPLALFGSAQFDTTQLDAFSLEINGEPARVALRRNGTPQLGFEDLDQDGWLDAVVSLESRNLAVTDEGPLTLTGRLRSRKPIVGNQPAEDPVRTTGPRRRSLP